MPPASLSTFAVINPGPTTAKKSRIRIFQRLKKFMRTFRRHKNETQPRTATRAAETTPYLCAYSRKGRHSEPHQNKRTSRLRTNEKRKDIKPKKSRDRKRSPHRKPETARLTPTLKLRSQHVDYFIGGNYAHQLILLIDDREHEQIVLIEQFGDCVVAHILVYPHKRYLSQ